MSRKWAAVVLLVLAACGQNGTKYSAPVSKQDSAMALSIREKAEQLKAAGYGIFDYVDETTNDTILMQQYFLVFLKRGAEQPAGEKKVQDSLQALHLAHLGRMYQEGYADISGPFGDDGEIRGITIYNTPTQAMADSLARLDPLVRMGFLEVEVHPWWAAKGFSLR